MAVVEVYVYFAGFIFLISIDSALLSQHQGTYIFCVVLSRYYWDILLTDFIDYFIKHQIEPLCILHSVLRSSIPGPS